MRLAAGTAWLLLLLFGGSATVRAEEGDLPVLVARVDGNSIHCNARIEAFERCARGLLGRMRASAERAYVEALGLGATESEIEAVFAYERAFRSHDRAQRSRKLVQLEERLASSTLENNERARLESFRTVLVRLARFDADVDEGVEQIDPLPREVAAAWVEQAKLDAALQRRFGGVVGVRASGMYAHGARAEMLRRHLVGHRIEWFDSSFASQFERALDAPPAIVYRSESADFTPFWLRPIPPSYMLD